MAFIIRRRRNRQRLLTRLRLNWGAAVRRTHKLGSIEAACRSRIAHFGDGPRLDDRTWRDLDLDEVFGAIDRTESTLGQQALYRRLRRQPTGHDLQAFEAVVDRLAGNPSEREQAQIALSRLQDPHGYDLWWLAQPGAVQSRTWYVLFPLLTIATVLAAILLALWPASLPAFLMLVAIDVGARYLAADKLTTLTLVFRQIAPIIATGEELSFLRSDEIAPLVGALASDVAPLRRLKLIARWLSGDPMMTSFATDRLSVIMVGAARALYEYLNIVFLLDANGIYFGARDVGRLGPSLLRVAAAIGEVDAAISVASWRAERDDWTRPQFMSAGSAAVIAGVRHPLIPGAVPNTVNLEPGHGLLVTGSNMTGKSTFIRTIGVNAVLAQSLNTCVATDYEAPIFQIRSCIGREDDLLAGKSYYLVEVEAMLELLDASTQSAPHLILCDELLRGTNTVERIAAAEAILTDLLSARGLRTPHVVVAATHDGELVDFLTGLYVPYHFADGLGADGLSFDYRLHRGATRSRNAIALLGQRGASAELVERAMSRAAALDRQRAVARTDAV